ncbi:cold shock domain-containing protein [Sphaerisporangium sp. NPDC051011]|uniref:cold shock domain-containing protein n=1 Tax=Sphaerisporangium sp. NPDC051011 TaxID=3155792 RepID=UPI0033E9514C
MKDRQPPAAPGSALQTNSESIRTRLPDSGGASYVPRYQAIYDTTERIATMGVEPVDAATGTVVEWNDDEGWGFIRSADVPGDVFAHFSSIVGMEGYRSLVPGQRVRFTWEQYPQDGFSFRVIHVFVGDAPTPSTQRLAGESDIDAYASRLQIQPDNQSE